MPFKLTLMYPAGTRGKLDVANVAFALVVATTLAAVTLTLPELMVTLVRVRLPMLAVDPPKDTLALPIVTALFARKLFGNVAATLVMFALEKLLFATVTLAMLPSVRVALLIVPPVMTTALAF